MCCHIGSVLALGPHRATYHTRAMVDERMTLRHSDVTIMLHYNNILPHPFRQGATACGHLQLVVAFVSNKDINIMAPNHQLFTHRKMYNHTLSSSFKIIKQSSQHLE